jgi:hypothetical protein
MTNSPADQDLDLDLTARRDLSPSRPVDAPAQILGEPSFRPLGTRRVVPRAIPPLQALAAASVARRRRKIPRNWPAWLLLLGSSAFMGAALKAVYLAYDGDRSVIHRAAAEVKTLVFAVLDGAPPAERRLRASATAVIVPVVGIVGASGDEPAQPSSAEIEAAVVVSPSADAEPRLAPAPSDEPQRQDDGAVATAPTSGATEPEPYLPPAPSAEPPAALAAAPVPSVALAPSAEPPAAPPPAAPVVERPPVVRMDPSEASRLKARGDELLRRRDVVAARLFFLRAADGGDAASAVAVGKTFDPAFLRRMGAIGIAGDRAQAAFWYARARDLGDQEADLLLRSLPPG